MDPKQKRILIRVVTAAATFAGVAFLPDLISGSGFAGASTDLGLGKLLASGSLLAFVVAFGGGVMTSLTPCVYPLIPVTVSVFGAKRASSRAEAMKLSALYVLGIAIMYSALGAFAALTHSGFGKVMTNPYVISFVAVVFAAMAASMFGAFELALPYGLQQRLAQVGGAGPAGALGMGLVAGIIAAPCTGPVLASALTFVATKASVGFGIGVMFVYALGLGLLFFLVGTFGISLPKSGAWMDTVKSIFGVALLAAALLYLKDAFPAMKTAFLASREFALLVAAGAGIGILLGALQGSFHGAVVEKLTKGFGVALVVGGVFLGVGSAGVRAQALAALPWRHNDSEALKAAMAEKKPVIVDFWADWCAACQELDRLAWADPRVKEEASRFVTVKMDGSEGAPRKDVFDGAFERYKLVGMPTVIFFDSEGKEHAERVTAAIPADEMLAKLKNVN
jgi:thiol:disulfide interchange protein DsbD